ncbi:MAG: beta strand repeat-containing protein [Alphaproteobacteria bacterium]
MANINGTEEGELITGLPEADFIIAGAGDDTVDGGGGNDIILGNEGADELTGGEGADNFFGRIENVDGDIITDFELGLSEEADRISIQFATSSVFALEFTDVGNDVELLINNFGDNTSATVTLLGLAGLNLTADIVTNAPLNSGEIFIFPADERPEDGLEVVGTDAGELLFGSESSDDIDARAGNDTIVPGAGQDLITTGLGRDLVFGQQGALNGDRITDFTFSDGPGAFQGNTADALVLSLADPANITTTFQTLGNDLVVTITDNGVSDVVTLDNALIQFGAAEVEFEAEIVSGTQVGLTDGAAVFIIANEIVNVAPVAVNDTFTAFDDETLIVNAANGLLQNDSDADGNLIVVEFVDGINGQVRIDLDGETVPLNNGEIFVRADGSFEYTAVDDNLTDAVFTYTLFDGIDEVTATVTIDVEQGNTPPEGTDDAYSVVPGTPLTVGTGSGLLANDTDAEGTALSVVSVNGDTGAVGNAVNVTGGTVTVAADGSFTFLRTPGASGTASFTYGLSDGTDTDTATVTVDLDGGSGGGSGGGNNGGGNNGGTVTATDDQFTADPDVLLNVAAQTGLLANDTGTNPVILSVNGIDLGEDGLVNLSLDGDGLLLVNQDGSFSFEKSGTDTSAVTFDYVVTDGTDTDSGTVTIEFGDTFDEVGTDSADSFDRQGSTANNSIDGAGGNDRVITGAGNDTVGGGAGNDFIDDIDNQDTGGNRLVGNDGDDTIIGRAGSYDIEGGAGNDNITVYAALGTNVVEGGGGNDTIELRRGTDNTIRGGAGDDRILVRKTIFNEIGLENKIFGGAGNDIIEIRDGYLNTIEGNAGDDLLIAGSGTDIFRFGAGFGNDTLRNFGTQGDDKIDLTEFAGLDFATFQSQVDSTGNGTFVWNAGDGDVLTIEALPFSGLNEAFFLFGDA